MRWRIAAGLFLGIWLTLLAVEFCEDAGLFDYDDPGMDRSINATLNSLGDAIQLDDYHHPLKIVFPACFVGMIDPYLQQGQPFQFILHGPAFIKASLKILTLIHVLLI